MHRKYLLLTVLLAFPAFPQTFQPLQYELGADIGYGIYHNGTILSPEGSIDAGIRNRFAAGIILGVDFSNYVSGELNFLYHDGHPFLQGLGVKADIQGQSWALTSSLLFYFKDRTHRFRPFVTGGVGAKEYIIAGPAPFPQPIPQVASLLTNDVWKVAFVAGGGVKYRVHRKVILRGEFLDYLTTFPRTQIFPAPHNTARGIFEQFTPLFGASYVF
jgi:opacity protein-like surface antigen